MDDFGMSVAGGALDRTLDLYYSIPQGFLNNWISTLGYNDRMSTNYDYAKKLIDYQNAYNSPKSQMQRLAEAGLNPNLIYGSSAPSGQSASGSIGSAPLTNNNFGTHDVVQGALAMAQMKQAQAAQDNLRADARLKNAEAANKEMYNEMYPELLEISVQQAQKNLEKTASDIEVSRSSVNYNNAQTALAEAETMFKRGEIDLQQFRKQQIIAQTNLFISESKLKEAQTDFTRSQDYALDIQTRIDTLELKYKEYFYGDDGSRKQLAKAEYERLYNQFLYDAQTDAALLGIEGNKGAQWANWIASWFGRILGGAGAAAVGTGSIIKALK